MPSGVGAFLRPSHGTLTGVDLETQLATALAALLVALVGFIRPVLAAVRRALVRRIDAAWPDDSADYETKVRRTVTRVRGVWWGSRGGIEREVRRARPSLPPREPADD